MKDHRFGLITNKLVDNFTSRTLIWAGPLVIAVKSLLKRLSCINMAYILRAA